MFRTSPCHVRYAKRLQHPISRVHDKDLVQKMQHLLKRSDENDGAHVRQFLRTMFFIHIQIAKHWIVQRINQLSIGSFLCPT